MTRFADLTRRGDGHSGSRRVHRRNVKLIAGGAGLAVIIVVALVGPSLLAVGPNEQQYDAILASPSAEHLLGTDHLGREVLSRIIAGLRISVLVGVLAATMATVFGVPLGLLAGTSRDLTDNIIMRPLDALMSFPAIVLALLIATVLGTGLDVVILSIGIVTVPTIAKVLRSSVISTRHELFVEASRARGASRLAILWKDIFPNSFGPTIIQATILMGVAVLLEATLSFLGVGVRPPQSSLGVMLSDGRAFMQQAPWVVAFPGAAIAALVLAFNLIGDGLRDLLDPR